MRRIEVSVASQSLAVLEGDEVTHRFPISTSALGVGSDLGSFKTPCGKFRIAEKIGDGAPPGAVFRSRLATGEIGKATMPDDLVQTRILWLDGLEPHNANTKERYIYIHGTNHESRIGEPASHGCVRMGNEDVIALYELVEEGAEVIIRA